MEKYNSIKNLFDNASSSNKKVSEYVLEDQANSLGISKEEIYDRMKEYYYVMCDSINEGLLNEHKLKIESGIDANKYYNYVDSGKSLLGKDMGFLVARALAVAEENASMGRIVASPTAGSAGILPAALYTIKVIKNFSDETIIKSLFTAAGVGLVFANITGIAGATCGCQAECGVAECMAAATITELLGGNIEAMKNSISICIKNIEGLVCDPVAGLVECPCIKRNGKGALDAFLAADMALAGIKSAIPVDEVLESMRQVGKFMDERLKETAKGGLAATCTGLKMNEIIFGKLTN